MSFPIRPSASHRSRTLPIAIVLLLLPVLVPAQAAAPDPCEDASCGVLRLFFHGGASTRLSSEPLPEGAPWLAPQGRFVAVGAPLSEPLALPGDGTILVSLAGREAHAPGSYWTRVHVAALVDGAEFRLAEASFVHPVAPLPGGTPEESDWDVVRVPIAATGGLLKEDGSAVLPAGSALRLRVDVEGPPAGSSFAYGAYSWPSHVALPVVGEPPLPSTATFIGPGHHARQAFGTDAFLHGGDTYAFRAEEGQRILVEVEGATAALTDPTGRAVDGLQVVAARGGAWRLDVRSTPTTRGYWFDLAVEDAPPADDGSGPQSL